MSSKWEFERYSPAWAGRWDEFVQSSRNGTFLFLRGYMGYHADRFADCSLLAYRDERLTALLPANITSDNILHSHQGLTYGGWVVPRVHFDAGDMLALFDEWLLWCKENGITEIDYKPLPWIYPSVPSQDDIYALFRQGATLAECNLSYAIDLMSPGEFNTNQKRLLKSVAALDTAILELEDLGEFHRMLTDCLAERHGAAPVHSLDVLQTLSRRFPANIRTFGLILNGQLACGICIYDTGTVAHAQYIATTPEGRKFGVLGTLVRHLTENVFRHRRYFDLGTSNEDHSRKLNPGLIHQKASFGATGVVYPRYKLKIT